ncbi:unnamed protein product [Lactuca saligna]|uniref:Uncharacterized protein n=1 Tax=Lactuca saligna TaxID=75948 RepID=A0AA36A2S8_LACSI|nr:unnamed protein product [Lactuca saligna]
MEKLRQHHRTEKQRASFPNESLNLGRGIRFKPSSVQNLVKLAASSTNHTPNFDYNFSNHDYSYMNNWSNQEDDNEDRYLDDSTFNEPLIHPVYKNHKSSPFTGGVCIKR